MLTCLFSVRRFLTQGLRRVRMGVCPALYNVLFFNELPCSLGRSTASLVLPPAGVIARVAGGFTPSTQLYHGGGLRPYCNIMDDAGMMIPAFGPIDVSGEQG
jgi:hypothetical protein